MGVELFGNVGTRFAAFRQAGTRVITASQSFLFLLCSPTVLTGSLENSRVLFSNVIVVVRAIGYRPRNASI